MRSILSNYDMSNISPSDFSKLIQQMSEKGVISQQDMQQLSSIRVDLENAGVNPDESVNLVQFYQQQLAKAQTAAAQSTNPAAAQPAINALMGRLNWLQKFTSLGGQGGVNAVADRVMRPACPDRGPVPSVAASCSALSRNTSRPDAG